MKLIDKIALKLASSSRKGAVINTIVLHWTAGGTALSSLSWLATARKGSYHYIVERDGTVYKAVPTSRAAWHTGWDVFGKVISKGPNGSGTVNSTSIGISFANIGNGKEVITSVQIKAAGELVKEIRAAIPSIEYVTTHHECAPKARPTELVGYPWAEWAKTWGLRIWRR